MEILNDNPSKVSIPYNFLRNLWIQSWGNSKPMQNLINTLETNQLRYIGLESHSYLLLQSPEISLEYLKMNLNASDKTKFATVLNEIEKTFLKVSLLNTAKVSENEIALYIENLETIKAYLENQDYTKGKKLGLSIMVIANMVSLAKQFKYNNIIGTYAAQNTAINLRDEQMAKNLIWYKERYKDSKIIIWTANFHGAKKIREIQYKEEDPDLYNDFRLLGEHLYSAYGNEVYSIAFTAAQGETLIPNGEQTKTQKIDAGNGTLEYELLDKGLEYGFIDFSAIRKSRPGLKDEIFNTIILGHDNKPGKWLHVFDGIFFLKTEQPLILQ